MAEDKAVILPLGPSAAGKATLGSWVAEDLGFQWIEIDVWGSDGIRLAGPPEERLRSG